MGGGRAPPIGTGPYVVRSRARGRELVLARNERFRGEAGGFATLRFEVVPDAGDRVRRVSEGKAAIATAPPLSELPRLEADRALRVVSAPGLRVVYLAFRVDEGPFADARVREAVDLAIDRDELIRRTLYGRAHPATQLVTPSVVGYDASIPPPN